MAASKSSRVNAGVGVGEMDNRVGILTKTTVTTDYGSESETWSVNKTVWAKVTWMDASEKFTADQEQVFDRIVVMMRYRSIDPEANRLRVESLDYDIESVVPIDRKMYLKITAKRIA